MSTILDFSKTEHSDADESFLTVSSSSASRSFSSAYITSYKYNDMQLLLSTDALTFSTLAGLELSLCQCGHFCLEF